jgi:hypothetical protein
MKNYSHNLDLLLDIHCKLTELNIKINDLHISKIACGNEDIIILEKLLIDIAIKLKIVDKCIENIEDIGKEDCESLVSIIDNWIQYIKGELNGD